MAVIRSMGPWSLDTGGWPMVINGQPECENGGALPRSLICLVPDDDDYDTAYEQELQTANAVAIAHLPECLELLERIGSNTAGLEPAAKARALLKKIELAQDEAKDY